MLCKIIQHVHHLSQGLRIPLFGMSRNNCKMGLHNSKCPLDILSSCLSLGNVSLFLANWVSDGADKGSPWRIDTVNQIVAHILLMPIDSIVASKILPIGQPRQQWRPLQHIDVIVRPGHAKDNVLNLEVLCWNCFKNDGGLLNMALVLPLLSFWTVLPSPMHKQSRDPSKSGHPLASDIANSLSVCATVGSLKH